MNALKIVEQDQSPKGVKFCFGEKSSGFKLINCSQAKLVAIIFVLSVFSLDRVLFDSFDFRPQKRDKQVAPSGH